MKKIQYARKVAKNMNDRQDQTMKGRAMFISVTRQKLVQQNLLSTYNASSLPFHCTVTSDPTVNCKHF